MSYAVCHDPSLDHCTPSVNRQPAPGTVLHVKASLRKRPQQVMLRATPFAAVIPGDSAVEAVLTTGFSSFL